MKQFTFIHDCKICNNMEYSFKSISLKSAKEFAKTKSSGSNLRVRCDETNRVYKIK